jgi:hypothetical protein
VEKMSEIKGGRLGEEKRSEERRDGTCGERGDKDVET